MNKNLLFFFLIIVFFSSSSEAQIPVQGINYQAVLRDADGNILKDKNVKVRLSILQDALTSSLIYTEEHSAVTNLFGLINIVIGTGDVTFGTIIHDIDWSTGKHQLQIEVDPDNSGTYTDMGKTPFQAVPYAFYSGGQAPAIPQIAFYSGNKADSIITISSSTFVPLVLISDSEISFNDGGAYDETSGIFTAPVSGVYSISANLQLEASANNIIYNIKLTKGTNDVVKRDGYVTGPNPRYANVSFNVVIKLLAGDSVNLNAASANGSYTIKQAQSNFNAYLVY